MTIFEAYGQKTTILQKIVVSVTNDLVSDQRVDRICTFLMNQGFKVLLIGRKLPNSLPIDRPYNTYRMGLAFRRGFFFYAEYSIRLFFTLLFTKKNVLWANDLDTLLPNYLISKLSRKPIVYDSHELFTEIPELTGRHKVRRIWLGIEQHILPKIKYVITVNESIAAFYSKKYNVVPLVVRNIAYRLQKGSGTSSVLKSIAKGKKMLILQGTGINIDRGAAEAVQMMRYLDDAVLFIIGNGDVFPNLKKLVGSLQLENRVIIKDKMPYPELMTYTTAAHLGLSLDKATNLNYEYSLPNKIFDYIQAETPILATNRLEVSKIIKEYNVGWTTEKIDPRKMARTVQEIFENTVEYQNKKRNCSKASGILCWENESKKLLPFLERIQEENKAFSKPKR